MRTHKSGQNMKKYLSIFLPTLLSACVSLPPTVETLKSNPGGHIRLTSPLQSAELYKAISEQSRACFTSMYWSIASDYFPDNTAAISMRMASISVNGVIWAADLVPSPGGTNVDFYYYTKEPDGFSKPVIGWIKNGPPMQCQ